MDALVHKEKSEMIRNAEAAVEKKAYAKPLVSQVRLRAEEAVLADCKLNGGLGLQTAQCGELEPCVQTATS